MNAKSGRTLFAAGLITAALASGAIGQQDDKLGKVTFPTSCDPAVQAEFDRGVAMLHSYWFLIARRKFEGILQQDPTCAMAHWGVAMDFLGNSLAATPSRADAQAAWDALEKARAAGPKTPGAEASASVFQSQAAREPSRTAMRSLVHCCLAKSDLEHVSASSRVTFGIMPRSP
jgi:Tfp pilus assembly protein PilF